MAEDRQERYIRFYTEGTAAYQVEVDQPRRKTRLPKVQKKTVHVISVDPVAIGGMVLCIVMLVLMLNCVAVLDAQRAQMQQMTDYLYELEGQNTVLSQKYRSQLDLEAVEERALVLGMIPIEQAQHITVTLEPEQEEPVIEQEPSFWEEICTYFEGLFA